MQWAPIGRLTISFMLALSAACSTPRILVDDDRARRTASPTSTPVVDSPSATGATAADSSQPVTESPAGAAGDAGARSLTPARVKSVVLAHYSALKKCFQSALGSNPSVDASVTVSWSIAPQGTVSDATVKESTSDHPELDACLVKEVGQLRFPAAMGKTNVTFPFASARK